jgi:hypothetical protein
VTASKLLSGVGNQRPDERATQEPSSHGWYRRSNKKVLAKKLSVAGNRRSSRFSTFNSRILGSNKAPFKVSPCCATNTEKKLNPGVRNHSGIESAHVSQLTHGIRKRLVESCSVCLQSIQRLYCHHHMPATSITLKLFTRNETHFLLRKRFQLRIH